MATDTSRPTANVPNDELRDEQLAFQVFSVLSGVAALVLFSESGYRFQRVEGHLPVLVPVALAFAMAWKPSNVWLALSFWATYAWFLLFVFPDINTNETLLFFVSVGVLGSALLCFVRQRNVQLSGAALFKAFNPLLRICVVILYFWTFWDKLNFDFVNPQVSCAVTLTAGLFSAVGLSPGMELIAAPSVVMTLVAEGALPFGLLFKRTQRATVILGLGFHWVLGIAGFYGFSSTMITLLTLFAFPLAGRTFAGYDGPSFIRSVSRTTVNRVVLLAYVAVMLIAKLVFNARLRDVGDWFWFVLPLIAAALWWNNRAEVGNARQVRDPTPPVWWLVLHPKPHYLIAIPVLLNGASHWVGFKTEYSFAMYSNLRTEGGRTNHLIWRRPLTLANYQTDLVYVLEGSDVAGLRTFGGRPVPRYEVAQWLRTTVTNDRRNGIVLVLGEGTEQRRIEFAERDSALMTEPSWIIKRLLKFRQIVPAQPGTCAH